MSALPIVLQALQAAPDVVSLAEGRIYTVQAPQGDPVPSVTVLLLSEVEEYTLAGAGDYPEATIACVCLAGTVTYAGRLGDAVVKALKNVTNFSDQRAFIMRDGTDSFDFIDASRVFRRIVGFKVRYRSD